MNLDGKGIRFWLDKKELIWRASRHDFEVSAPTFVECRDRAVAAIEELEVRDERR